MAQSLKTLIPVTIVFAVLIATNLLYAQWRAPNGPPSPANNAPAPINVSTTNQMKPGDITALNLKAGSQVWAPEYCDENGQNCFVGADTNAFRIGANFPPPPPSGLCEGYRSEPFRPSLSMDKGKLIALYTYPMNSGCAVGWCSVGYDGSDYYYIDSSYDDRDCGR